MGPSTTGSRGKAATSSGAAPYKATRRWGRRGATRRAVGVAGERGDAFVRLDSHFDRSGLSDSPDARAGRVPRRNAAPVVPPDARGRDRRPAREARCLDGSAAAVLLPLLLGARSTMGIATSGTATALRCGPAAGRPRSPDGRLRAGSATHSRLLTVDCVPYPAPPLHRDPALPQGGGLVRAVPPGVRGPSAAHQRRAGGRPVLPADLHPDGVLLPYRPASGLGVRERRRQPALPPVLGRVTPGRADRRRLLATPGQRKVLRSEVRTLERTVARSDRSRAALLLDRAGRLPHHGARRRRAWTGSSLSYTRFTPSPSAASITRMSRTSRISPVGSIDAAWSLPHIARSTA